MSLLGLSWKECAAITCPVCLKFFNETDKRPIALGCGHTVCKDCVKNEFKGDRCPFDQYQLQGDVNSMPANYALMPIIERALLAEAEEERAAQGTVAEVDSSWCYEQAVKYVEEMAKHLEPLVLDNSTEDDSNDESRTRRNINPPRCLLSQQMQRKVISLIHCQLLEEEGRARAARLAHAMASRAVLEILAALASPSQLSTSLWAAVRTRGCQFLGPAMQEEVLNLIVLALEDGNFLSRKVLVLFVVQRLAAQYPQASKTAIGHVVQLLYRASCFKVVKKEEESSVMQLKSEFRSYEALRREHDAQIVTIAAEAGLRISPEQWSSLLYGDGGHKSHMQSIIDKHQIPHTFSQSVAELVSTLQRTGDHANLAQLQPQLDFLASIDPNPDCPAPSWENLEAIMRSLNTVLSALVRFLTLPTCQKVSEIPQASGRFKTSMCRDFLSRGTCPRGTNCTFAHSNQELDRYRSRSRRSLSKPSTLITDQSEAMLQMSRLSLNDNNGVSLSTDVNPAHTRANTTGATHITFTQGTARAPDSMRAPTASNQTYFHPHNCGALPPTNTYPKPAYPHQTSVPPHQTPVPPHIVPQCLHSRGGNHCLQCPPPSHFLNAVQTPSRPQVRQDPAVISQCGATVSPVMTTQSVAITSMSGTLDPSSLQDTLPSGGRKITGLNCQEESLVSLKSRKQELISHLHDSPVFMGTEADVYQADNHRAGFAGLKTVLGHNKRTRSAMPKLVSDMFVATRSTQSLDDLIFEDVNTNLPPKDELLTCGKSFDPDVCPTITPTKPDPPVYNPCGLWTDPPFTQPTDNYPDIMLGNDGLYNSLSYDFQEDHILFPSDLDSNCLSTGDDCLIPLPHASVSKFGPISRMAKAKTGNAAPVQVTADSSNRNTPMLAVTPLERPFSVVSVVSGQSGLTRHCPGNLEAGEPSVNMTPKEKPSVWQHTPCPSYKNIALLRAGAAEAVTHNERLAYELQAVELEISMKTGQTPQTVGKMIQSAVSSPPRSPDCLPRQSCPGFATLEKGGQAELGSGHVTDFLLK